jgi:hypothetical protein
MTPLIEKKDWVVKGWNNNKKLNKKNTKNYYNK